MAMGVAPPEVGRRPVAAIDGGAGGEAPLEVAGMGKLPAEGAPDLGVDRKGAAPVGGVPAMTAGGEGEEEDVEGEEEEEEEEEEDGVKWLKHYSSMQSILLVGDGDFSFSLALATAFGSGANPVATTLETYDNLRVKYRKAESNIMELKRLGATVLHGVDMQRMKFHAAVKNRRFGRIVFNFPHAGFKGHERQMHMIKLHKELVTGFFRNAWHLLRHFGEIHVSHKTEPPYDKWDLENLASESSLVLIEKVGFRKADYPGYNQKKGDGAKCDHPFKLGPCCTFKFEIRDLKKRKKLNGIRAGPDSSTILTVGGNDDHPDKLATFPVSAVRTPITLDPCMVAQR